MEALDRICRAFERASPLNALHACRPDHPLGRDNRWKWRNALAHVHQGTYAERSAINHRDLNWLTSMAEAEAREAK